MHLQRAMAEECEWIARASHQRPVVHLIDRHHRNRDSASMGLEEAKRLRDSLTVAIETIEAREAECLAQCAGR